METGLARTLYMCSVSVRLLQVLETGGTEPGLLLENGVLTTIRSTLTACSRLPSRRSKDPSFRVRFPVFVRVRWDHMVWDHVRRSVIIQVLVIHGGVCSPPELIINSNCTIISILSNMVYTNQIS